MMTLEQMAQVRSAERAVSNLSNPEAFVAKLAKTNPDMAAKLAHLFSKIDAGTLEMTDDDGDMIDDRRPQHEGDAEAWGYA